MLKIIHTEDGSQSLYDDELNETYHSIKGAKSESQYVFIEKGLAFFTHLLSNDQCPISILEIGFGTGLNALLTWKWAEKEKTLIHFYSLEPHPISELILDKMALRSDAQFNQLHHANWNQKVQMGEYFVLEKWIKRLEELMEENRFDVIFFDAFAPSKQPDIWSIENLKRCYKSLKIKGILTTYCAQRQFKKDLSLAGFDVEVLPGALGKKEMVRGRKK